VGVEGMLLTRFNNFQKWREGQGYIFHRLIGVESESGSGPHISQINRHGIITVK